MKRLQLCAVVLFIVAVAVIVALAVNGNQATAFSTGWNGGCGTCHGTTGTPSSGTGIHAVSAHRNLELHPVPCHGRRHPGPRKMRRLPRQRHGDRSELHACGQ